MLIRVAFGNGVARLCLYLPIPLAQMASSPPFKQGVEDEVTGSNPICISFCIYLQKDASKSGGSRANVI